MPTTFIKLFGTPTLNVASLSQATIGQRKAEIALVLDNTGSMASQNKMTELKKASLNLVASMEAASPMGVGMIKAALVPFDTHVKLDANANRNASWLATLDTASDSSFDDIRNRNQRYRSKMASKAGWTGCITDRGNGLQQQCAPLVAGPATLRFIPR